MFNKNWLLIGLLLLAVIYFFTQREEFNPDPENNVEMERLNAALEEYMVCQNEPLALECQGRVYDFTTLKQKMECCGYPKYQDMPARTFVEVYNKRRMKKAPLSINELREMIRPETQCWVDRRKYFQ